MIVMDLDGTLLNKKRNITEMLKNICKGFPYIRRKKLVQDSFGKEKFKLCN